MFWSDDFSIILKKSSHETIIITLAHSAVSYYSHSYNYLVVAVVVVEAEKYG